MPAGPDCGALPTPPLTAPNYSEKTLIADGYLRVRREPVPEVTGM